MGVWLRVEDQQGVIGSERETIAEDLLQTKPIQDEVLKILRDSYRGNRSNVNKWKKAHNRIRNHISNPPTIPYPTRSSTDPIQAQSVEGWCSLVWAKIHRLLAARTPFSTGERPIAAGQCFITYSLRALATSWSIPTVGFRTGCRNVRS